MRGANCKIRFQVSKLVEVFICVKLVEFHNGGWCHSWDIRRPIKIIKNHQESKDIKSGKREL